MIEIDPKIELISFPMSAGLVALYLYRVSLGDVSFPSSENLSPPG